MNIKITGISRLEKPLAQEWAGTGLVYTVNKKGREDTVSDPRTGAVIIDFWSFEELFEFCGLGEVDRAAFGDSSALVIQCGGWQSWSPGWELAGGETLPRKVRLLPELLKMTNRDGDTAAPSSLPDSVEPFLLPAELGGRDWLVGHFITYLRSGDRWLCIASKGGGALPPVSWRINRARKLIIPEIFCPGKVWKPEETLAELWVFFARGYFNFKDMLRVLYDQARAFQSINFLGDVPGGYESWYNRYTDINEKLILDDLEGLGKTENLIKLLYSDRHKPAVFQIDDGWERAVGEWEADSRRFPKGLAPAAARITEAGYIPGLWLAPFLVTRRSRIFTERPGWLLREKQGEPAAVISGVFRIPVTGQVTEAEQGRPVTAGFNPNWDGRFYCLDLSRKDVLEYLRGIMDKVIDNWGFRYIKLDFLYAGLLSGDFAEGGSPHEHYERACAVLTGRDKTTGGLPVAYLGCGLPLGPSYRHFPLSRIGADTREEWEWKLTKFLGHLGAPGAYISLMDTIGRSFMNGTVYINDPDVIFLRTRNCKLTEDEKELIALTNFLLGGQIMFSDDPLNLEKAGIALTGRIAGLYDRLAGGEYGAVRLARDVFRLESRSGEIWGLINLSKRPFPLDRDGGPKIQAGEDRRMAAELYAALSSGVFLTDHRLKPPKRAAPGTVVFAPHTITVVSRNPPGP
jgi:alpha-galactosidase